MSISLEGVLLECGMWGKGIGPPAPDVPTMVSVLGGREEESSRLEDWDSGRRCEDFSKQIRTVFEECRTSKGIAKERKILGSDRLGRRDGKTTVEHLTEWFEETWWIRL